MSAPSPKAVAEVRGSTIHAEIDIAAPPEAVFRALTTPAELMTWWGSPEMYVADSWEVDLRVGGKWKSVGHRSDQHAFTVEGEYLEIDPPRLLVHTWRPSFDGLQTTIVRYELAPSGTGTRLTLTHSGFDERAESARDHGNHWPLVLGWLAAHVARTHTNAAPFARSHA